MAPFLTDDLLLEILSRGDAKSLCRFKCASTHMLALIDHPDNGERLPKPIAGFVYTFSTTTTTKDDDDQLAHRIYREDLCFFDVSGRSHNSISSPSFAFLPEHLGVHVLDGCNGLLLCRCLYDFPAARSYASRYVVCNPATQQWAMLPARHQPGERDTVRLGFDPTVSPHFHVFAILLGNPCYVTGVNVYSSETKRWVYKDSGPCQPTWLSVNQSATVFLNGYLHFCTISPVDWTCRVAAVDTEGETWTSFDRPKDFYDGFIQLSQGRLHYVMFAKHEHEEGDADDIRLEVYVMDDYDNKEWTLKHSIKAADIFEEMHVDNIRSVRLVAIHPDCSNLIFFTVGRDVSLVCYSISSRRTKSITTDLGTVRLPYVPYAPMYSELQSLDCIQVGRGPMEGSPVPAEGPTPRTIYMVHPMATKRGPISSPAHDVSTWATEWWQQHGKRMMDNIRSYVRDQENSSMHWLRSIMYNHQEEKKSL